MPAKRISRSLTSKFKHHLNGKRVSGNSSKDSTKTAERETRSPFLRESLGAADTLWLAASTKPVVRGQKKTPADYQKQSFEAKQTHCVSEWPTYQCHKNLRTLVSTGFSPRMVLRACTGSYRYGCTADFCCVTPPALSSGLCFLAAHRNEMEQINLA